MFSSMNTSMGSFTLAPIPEDGSPRKTSDAKLTRSFSATPTPSANPRVCLEICSATTTNSSRAVSESSGQDDMRAPSKSAQFSTQGSTTESTGSAWSADSAVAGMVSKGLFEANKTLKVEINTRPEPRLSRFAQQTGNLNFEKSAAVTDGDTVTRHLPVLTQFAKGLSAQQYQAISAEVRAHTSG